MNWESMITAPTDGTKVLLIATIITPDTVDATENPVPVVAWFNEGWTTYGGFQLLYQRYWRPVLPTPLRPDPAQME